MFLISDAFVKVSILSEDGKRLKKKKTLTKKATTSPIFNEEIVFTNLKKEQLDSIKILFTIKHDSLTSSENLGTVFISSMATGNELLQWKEMLDGKKSIAWWHTITNFYSDPFESDANNSNGTSSSQNKLFDKIHGFYDKKSSVGNLLANLSNFKMKP